MDPTKTITVGPSTIEHSGITPIAALPNIFTPPSDCLSPTVNTSPQSCYPTRFSEYLTGIAHYYSPAICPSGYSIACELPASWDVSTWHGPSLDPGETAQSCCPTSYACETIDEFFRFRSISLFCTSSSAKVTAIQIRWKETDIPALETHPLTPGLRPTSTIKTSPAQNTSNANNLADTAGDSLPIGVKIGVAAGAILIFFIFASAAIMIIWKKKQKKKKTEKATSIELSLSKRPEPSSFPEVCLDTTRYIYRPGSSHSHLFEAPGTIVQPWSAVNNTRQDAVEIPPGDAHSGVPEAYSRPVYELPSHNRGH